ncbi:serotonin N-acetyltransferase-like [Scyliorhinus canicula]|uniref:serotonin N-acetyltransferase-like n=1 Tax=Scyliorhinus canicula TaxID=7830 RepID=UPI0018F4245F|nr:serotonin N-acetyltransferase-like [Scyliorhinus canicula]
MERAAGEIRTVSQGDISAAWALEAAGFPPEEAASLAKLQYRQREAGDLFLGHFINDKLIGFVCGTRSLADHLTEKSMQVHEPAGTTVCIHSVCVDEAWRRRGVALGLLRHYVASVMQTHPALRRICLISHQHLLPLYTKAGFTMIGPSSVNHGLEAWYECIFNLST